MTENFIPLGLLLALLSGAKFCQKCGDVVPTKLRRTPVFCPYCGSSLNRS